MRTIQQPAPSTWRLPVAPVCRTVLTGLLLALSASSVGAAIFHCTAADGTATFSDHACEPPKGNDVPLPDRPAAPDAEAYAHRPDTPREKKAASILNQLRIAPVEPEAILIGRTVDDATPDLVKSIDPDNPLWTPANGRWRSVFEFVRADLRRDVQTALRSSTAQVAQVTARQYAARTDDNEMEALAAFLSTSDGKRYIAFQNEIRPLLYAALAAVMAQEPMPESTQGERELSQRRRLLFLAFEYCIAKDGGGPASVSLQPGSKTVLENAVRREAATLDTLFAEYEPFLPAFEAFTSSSTAKHFFVAVEPALRTELALSSTATTDFAEQEFEKYLPRWRGFYGPMRTTTRTAVIIRGRSVLIARAMTSRVLPGAQSPEAMAIQCEQREEALYRATHRAADYNTQATAVKRIQARCRAEQRLPAL